MINFVDLQIFLSLYGQAVTGPISRRYRYALTDQLGSILGYVDDRGDTLSDEARRYDAFGQPLDTNGSVTRLDSNVTDRGFSGHEHLDAVGLIHMNGRVYDPALGKFISPDPFITDLTNPQSHNRYSYVINNPQSLIDPSGYTYLQIDNGQRGWRLLDDDEDDSGTGGGPPHTPPVTIPDDNSGSGAQWPLQLPFRLTGIQGFYYGSEPEPFVGAVQGHGFNDELEVAADVDETSRTQQVVGHVVDFTPVIGDIKGIIDAYNDPTAINILAAGVGVFGPVGDVAGKVLKKVPNSKPASLSPPGAGRSGAFNEAKRQAGIPTSQQPSRVLPNVDRRGNPQPGRIYEYEVPAPGGGTRTVRIRDDAGGSYYGRGDPQNRGPHFNNEAGNHYDYDE